MLLRSMLVLLAVSWPCAASPGLGEGEQARDLLEALGANVREVSRADPALEVDFHLHGRAVQDQDLALLAELPAVVRLHLGHSAITDAGLVHLASLSELRSLDLSNTSLDGSGLQHLTGLQQLEVLNLYGTQVDDAALASLDALPALKRVYLWGTAVSWDAAAELVTARPELRVDLGATARPFPAPFQPTPASRAAALARIEELGGAVRKVSQDGDAVEVDFHLSAREVADADLQHLLSVDQLVELNLAQCASISDQGMASIAQLRGLQRLHLQKTGVGDAGLAKLRRLRELQYLNLYGTKVSDEGLGAVAAMPRLEKVFLWQTAVSWDGAELLKGRREGLRVDRGWDADGPPAWVTPTEEEQAAAELAITEIGGAIRRLDQESEDVEIDFHLGGRELSDEGLAHVRKIPNVVELHLGGTKVTSAGMVHLAGLPKLERLHLENTVVDDAALEQLRFNTGLRYLNLYGTQVSDEGLRRLRTLRHLERLYLWQSKATPAGVQELARWIPGLQAEFGWELEPAEGGEAAATGGA